MRDYHRKLLEEQIDQLTYPAKLPTDIRRLLAAKSHEISSAKQKEQHELSQRLHTVQRGRYVKADELPATSKAIIKKVEKAKADLKALTDALEATGVRASATAGEYVIQGSEAEYVATRQAIQDQIAALDGKYQKQYDDLRAVTVELATKQVAALKAKIDTAAPEVAARLNAI